MILVQFIGVGGQRIARGGNGCGSESRQKGHDGRPINARMTGVAVHWRVAELYTVRPARNRAQDVAAVVDKRIQPQTGAHVLLVRCFLDKVHGREAVRKAAIAKRGPCFKRSPPSAERNDDERMSSCSQCTNRFHCARHIDSGVFVFTVATVRLVDSQYTADINANLQWHL